MKKLLVILICIIASFSLLACDLILPDEAVDFVEDALENVTFSRGLLYRFDNDAEGYVVTGIGTCTDVDIVIPKTYNGYPVVAIGSYAFSSCSSLTSVTFEDPTGWWYSSSSSATSGTAISESSLANASTAAYYLRDYYYSSYYWFKY